MDVSDSGWGLVTCYSEYSEHVNEALGSIKYGEIC
jgi:hypothetical protein